MEQIAAIPAITTLCLLLAQGYKSFMAKSTYKHIPTLCGVLGLTLGVVCFVFIPGYIPAENALVAAAIGAVSGWAATGAHETYKQNS